MFERILVPVDFSDHCLAAFGHAAMFARAFRSTLELVHVVELAAHTPPAFWTGEPGLATELERLALENAEAAFQKLLAAPDVASVPALETRVLAGALPGAIIDRASESGAGLITISTHGRTGFSRWLMGSVSERLLRAASCPVLVARATTGASTPALRRLLVAVDFSERSRRALQVAGELADRFGASLEVLYVWTPPFYEGLSVSHAGLFDTIRDKARGELDRFVEAAGLAPSVAVARVVESGSPAARISERASETEPDLLVLGSHGHGALGRLVLGSVAETTVRYAPCTTLVIP